jgi:hypothetical protein
MGMQLFKTRSENNIMGHFSARSICRTRKKYIDLRGNFGLFLFVWLFFGFGSAHLNAQSVTPGQIFQPVSGAGQIVLDPNGDEQRRTLSRRGGAFLFEGLAPGPWQLRVYEHNLPARSVLENGNRALHVEAGQTHELKVRILPRQQRIRIIDEGQLSSVN